MFLWGAATSSHQVEGGNEFNDWWKWEAQGNIETGERSGRAADHWNRYEEDLRLAAEMGLNSYRFSIEWSRLEPERGKWDLNAVGRYAEIIATCERLGLVPMVTLLHFTLPQWLTEMGGFAHPESPALFRGYVKQVLRVLGPRVPLWCTLNEPMTWVIGQYLGGFMPPAEFHPTKVALCNRNLLHAHVLAHDLLHRESGRREGPWKEMPIGVGIAHNMVDFLPAHSWNPMERYLTRIFRRFYNRSWLDAIAGRSQHFGVRGFIPYAAPLHEARSRRTADFIGINYYTKCYIHWGALRTQQKEGVYYGKSGLLTMGVTFSKPGDVTSELGWAVHPHGLGRMIRFVKRYKLPIYITENGIADAKDSLRADYLKAHLKEVVKENKNGADVRGYYHWSLIDNFEWIKGFWPRFGLIEIDYETMERRVRKSARVYGEMIKAGT